MKIKLTQFIPALVALLGFVAAPISYWCIYSDKYCYGTWVHQVYQYLTNPLYNFSLYFLPVALLLIFVPRALFNSWLKLAAWVVPLAFIFIATQPVSWDGIGINFIFISRDDMARYTAEILDVLSLVLIIWKSFTARRHAGV